MRHNAKSKARMALDRSIVVRGETGNPADVEDALSDAASKTVKPDMTDREVLDFAATYLDDFENLHFDIANRRAAYLKARSFGVRD